MRTRLHRSDVPFPRHRDQVQEPGRLLRGGTGAALPVRKDRRDRGHLRGRGRDGILRRCDVRRDLRELQRRLQQARHTRGPPGERQGRFALHGRRSEGIQGLRREQHPRGHLQPDVQEGLRRRRPPREGDGHRAPGIRPEGVRSRTGEQASRIGPARGDRIPEGEAPQARSGTRGIGRHRQADRDREQRPRTRIFRAGGRTYRQKGPHRIRRGRCVLLHIRGQHRNPRTHGSGDRQVLPHQGSEAPRCGRDYPLRRVPRAPRRGAGIQHPDARGYPHQDRGRDAVHRRMRRIHVPPREDGGPRRDREEDVRSDPRKDMEHREALQIRLCIAPARGRQGDDALQARHQRPRVPLLG